MLDQFLVNKNIAIGDAAIKVGAATVQIFKLPAMVSPGVYPKPIPVGGMASRSIRTEPAISHLVRVLRFFSYFTTQANLLVVATSVSLAFRADRDGSSWRVARLNALTGITITAVVHPPRPTARRRGTRSPGAVTSRRSRRYRPSCPTRPAGRSSVTSRTTTNVRRKRSRTIRIDRGDLEVVWSKVHGTAAEVASCCW
jgi:hypothetical protein